MADDVVNVYEMWSRRRFEKQGQFLIAVRAFSALVGSPDVTPDLVANHADVPKVGDPWPVFENSITLHAARVRVVEQTTPLIYIVEVEYDTSAPLTEPPYDPLQEPPDVEWDGLTYEEDCDVDVTGKPLLNPAGDWIRGLKRERHDSVLRYTRNEAVYSEAAARQYRGKINSADFLGAPPQCVKCNKLKGRRYFQNGFPYFKIEYEFQFRETPRIADEQIVPGWVSNVVLQGVNEIGPDGKRRMIRNEGDAVASGQPMLLDRNGRAKPIVPGQLPKAEKELFFFYNETDFNQLNIVL